MAQENRNEIRENRKEIIDVKKILHQEFGKLVDLKAKIIHSSEAQKLQSDRQFFLTLSLTFFAIGISIPGFFSYTGIEKIYTYTIWMILLLAISYCIYRIGKIHGEIDALKQKIWANEIDDKAFRKGFEDEELIEEGRESIESRKKEIFNDEGSLNEIEAFVEGFFNSLGLRKKRYFKKKDEEG